jgi:hypothetical protein
VNTQILGPVRNSSMYFEVVLSKVETPQNKHCHTFFSNSHLKLLSNVYLTMFIQSPPCPLSKTCTVLGGPLIFSSADLNMISGKVRAKSLILA